MSERQDLSLKDSSGHRLCVTVSKEFRLVRIEQDGGDEITMDLTEFEYLANWVLERKRSTP